MGWVQRGNWRERAEYLYYSLFLSLLSLSLCVVLIVEGELLPPDGKGNSRVADNGPIDV